MVAKFDCFVALAVLICSISFVDGSFLSPVSIASTVPVSTRGDIPASGKYWARDTAVLSCHKPTVSIASTTTAFLPPTVSSSKASSAASWSGGLSVPASEVLPILPNSETFLHKSASSSTTWSLSISEPVLTRPASSTEAMTSSQASTTTSCTEVKAGSSLQPGLLVSSCSKTRSALSTYVLQSVVSSADLSLPTSNTPDPPFSSSSDCNTSLVVSSEYSPPSTRVSSLPSAYTCGTSDPTSTSTDSSAGTTITIWTTTILFSGTTIKTTLYKPMFPISSLPPWPSSALSDSTTPTAYGPESSMSSMPSIESSDINRDPSVSESWPVSIPTEDSLAGNPSSTPIRTASFILLTPTKTYSLPPLASDLRSASTVSKIFVTTTWSQEYEHTVEPPTMSSDITTTPDPYSVSSAYAEPSPEFASSGKPSTSARRTLFTKSVTAMGTWVASATPPSAQSGSSSLVFSSCLVMAFVFATSILVPLVVW